MNNKNNIIDFISESKKPKNEVKFSTDTYEDKVYEPAEYISPESKIEKDIEAEKEIQNLKKIISGKQIQLEKKQKTIGNIKKFIAILTAGAVAVTLGAFISKHKKEIKEALKDIGKIPTAPTELNGKYPGQPDPQYEAERASVIAEENATSIPQQIASGEYDEYIRGGK